MGGHPLIDALRRLRPAAGAAFLLAFLPTLQGGCAGPGYRDHHVPAFVAPGAPSHSHRTYPVRLREADSELLPGGIRLIRPDRAKPAPEFALRDEQGILHTPQLLRGRVVWMDLWAVWCGTCRAEFPFMDVLQRRFERNGLSILAVCRNSDRDSFVAAAHKDWIHFPTIDANDQSDFPFPYRAFPTSVLIDRWGRIRAYWQGHRTPDAMEGALRRLLAEAGPDSSQSIPTAGAGTEEGQSMAASADVLRARVDLVRDSLPAGGYFEGTVTLDVDPGWFLNADHQEGAVPLKIRFGDSPAFRVLDCRLPVPVPVETSTGARAGHQGRLEMPLWGLLAVDLPRGRPVDLKVVATVQACDDTQCLAPSDVVLACRLWVSDDAGVEP